ncbi:hypothetical protein M8J77_012652 [Diaphorina citri]|nr:hypothetical protein M8J77_012652 [Diaphorina citri]
MLCKHVQTSATHIKDIRQKTANLSDTHKCLLQCSKNFAATFSNTSKLTNFIALHVALHKSGPTIRIEGPLLNKNKEKILKREKRRKKKNRKR